MPCTEPLDVSNLEALLESAQLLHASLDLDELLKHLLRTAMGRLVGAARARRRPRTAT